MTRVVYVAMKPQLRGRIRRNVSTLLELGADVTVLTVAGASDFFVGLEHPRLRAEFLEARSVYVRWSMWTSRRSRELADRRRDRESRQRSGQGPVRQALTTPVYLMTALVLLLGRLPYPLAARLRRGWRRLPLPVRRLGWAVTRWRIRARRRLRRRCRRWWLREVGPRFRLVVRRRGAKQLRRVRRERVARLRQTSTQRRMLINRAVRRRRELRRALINRRLAARRTWIARTKDVLRPWHRVTRFFAFWRESAARAVELGPDLLVSSDLPGLVGAGRAARRLGVGHLHDCHELYLESTSFRPVERRILAPMERRHLRRADSVVAVNRSIALEYGRRYGREPQVVRNCAPQLAGDLRPRDLRVLAGLPADARVVLYQGGFSVGRGLDVCISAVQQLPVDVQLVLLGFGPLRDELAAHADRLGVGDRVHVVDAVPPDELAVWTISATVGLMPYQPVSRNNMLALPNKIFEYTAAGVPIVVSDFPELRRVAVEAGCGEVYDPFDASSLATALRLVLDPGRNAVYREAARRFGQVNVWENERSILVEAMLRACPALADSETEAANRARAEPPTAASSLDFRSLDSRSAGSFARGA
jgi:glycosyltransferase involved in cell wall biosynthesis